MENCGKCEKTCHDRKKKLLVSEPNDHTRKFFRENLLAIEMKKSQILMHKLVCLGLSIIELVKY